MNQEGDRWTTTRKSVASVVRSILTLTNSAAIVGLNFMFLSCMTCRGLNPSRFLVMSWVPMGTRLRPWRSFLQFWMVEMRSCSPIRSTECPQAMSRATSLPFSPSTCKKTGGRGVQEKTTSVHFRINYLILKWEDEVVFCYLYYTEDTEIMENTEFET